MQSAETFNLIIIKSSLIPHFFHFLIRLLNKVIRDGFVKIAKSFRSLYKRHHIQQLELRLIEL